MKTVLTVVLTLLLGVAPVALASDVALMEKDELKDMLGSADLVVLDVRAGRDWSSSEFKIAGATREDPGDVAYQIVENALEPFGKRLCEYSKLGLHNEAKLYCKGILEGIIQYSKSSASEFKDWAEDCPETCFENM